MKNDAKEMTVTSYGMFTTRGNWMVGRIVEAAQKIATADGDENGWRFGYRELSKLATADEFGEATDTDVREQVYEAVVKDHFTVPFYI